jgi:hypothetical protein
MKQKGPAASEGRPGRGLLACFPLGLLVELIPNVQHLTAQVF